MLKIDPLQTNFSSGELSPWLLGRTDVERYASGAERVENFIVRAQGPLFRRRGTKYIAAAPTHSAGAVVRIIDFVFSRDDSVLIEITAGKFRFYVNDSIVMNGLNPYEVTTVHGTSLPVPYAADEINELQFTQSADVVYITHPNHPQATLSRVAATDWRFEYIEFEHGPYLDQKAGDQDISLTVHSVYDRVILTSTEADFTATVVDDLIQYHHAGQKVLGRVTIKFNDYEVEVEPLEDRSLAMPKEVYSPGLYTGWDGTNSVPTYDSSITGTGVSVAFSAVSVVTQEHIGNYLRFTDRAGTYYWMLVDGVSDIPRQGAYGILATGDIIEPTIPTGQITRSERHINARLRASETGFFNLSTDGGRLFRLVLGGTVVHARGRAEVTRTCDMEIANRNIGLSDTSGLLVGDTVIGTGIQAGTIIEYIVENQYIHVSQDPTSTDNAVSLTFNLNSTQEIGVELNRSVPRSVEGLTAVQDGITNDWNRGAWYTGNYPSTVSFHEGRLCFAGTPLQPQTIWMSVVDDFYNFAAVSERLKVSDDNAITLTLASDTVNLIQWMISRKVLIVGTTFSEWVVTSTNQGSPVTPTTVTVHANTAWGSAYTRPINIGTSTLYLQRGGRKLREMSYDYQVDGQVSLDLTVFAEHIFRAHGNAKQLAYQQLPESVVYVLLGDGQLASLTYEPDQKVYAWSRQILGGGRVESIATIPDGDRDLLYLVVSRTINGSNYRTIEMLEPEFAPTSPTDKAAMIFMDGYSTGTALVGGYISGLMRMAGATVDVLIDDLLYEDIPVSEAGSLLAPAIPTTRWVVGFPYRSLVKMFPPEFMLQTGTTQHRPMRISHLTLRLIDSIGFSHGRSENSLATEEFRIASDPVNASPPLFTGDKRVNFEPGYDTRLAYYITQEKSYPLSILVVIPEVVIH